MDLKGKENKTTGFVVHTCNFSTQEAEDSKAKASVGQRRPAWASLGYRLYIARPYSQTRRWKRRDQSPLLLSLLLSAQRKDTHAKGSL